MRDHFAWGDDLRVETIDIDEPAKEVVRSYQPGDPILRTARFKIYRRGVMGVWEGKVDLGGGAVVAKVFKPDARAMVAIEEVLLIEATVKGRSPLSGSAAAARPARRTGIYVRRSVDGGQFRARDRKRPPRVELLHLDAGPFPLDNYYGSSRGGVAQRSSIWRLWRSCASRIISRRAATTSRCRARR